MITQATAKFALTEGEFTMEDHELLSVIGMTVDWRYYWFISQMNRDT